MSTQRFNFICALMALVLSPITYSMRMDKAAEPKEVSIYSPKPVVGRTGDPYRQRIPSLAFLTLQHVCQQYPEEFPATVKEKLSFIFGKEGLLQCLTDDSSSGSLYTVFNKMTPTAPEDRLSDIPQNLTLGMLPLKHQAELLEKLNPYVFWKKVSIGGDKSDNHSCLYPSKPDYYPLDERGDIIFVGALNKVCGRSGIITSLDMRKQREYVVSWDTGTDKAVDARCFQASKSGKWCAFYAFLPTGAFYNSLWLYEKATTSHVYYEKNSPEPYSSSSTTEYLSSMPIPGIPAESISHVLFSEDEKTIEVETSTNNYIIDLEKTKAVVTDRKTLLVHKVMGRIEKGVQFKIGDTLFTCKEKGGIDLRKKENFNAKYGKPYNLKKLPEPLFYITKDSKTVVGFFPGKKKKLRDCRARMQVITKDVPGCLEEYKNFTMRELVSKLRPSEMSDDSEEDSE